jgi:hypothetical protein
MGTGTFGELCCNSCSVSSTSDHATGEALTTIAVTARKRPALRRSRARLFISTEAVYRSLYAQTRAIRA